MGFQSAPGVMRYSLAGISISARELGEELGDRSLGILALEPLARESEELADELLPAQGGRISIRISAGPAPAFQFSWSSPGAAVTVSPGPATDS